MEYFSYQLTPCLVFPILLQPCVCKDKPDMRSRSFVRDMVSLASAESCYCFISVWTSSLPTGRRSKVEATVVTAGRQWKLMRLSGAPSTDHGARSPYHCTSLEAPACAFHWIKFELILLHFSSMYIYLKKKWIQVYYNRCKLLDHWKCPKIDISSTYMKRKWLENVSTWEAGRCLDPNCIRLFNCIPSF